MSETVYSQSLKGIQQKRTLAQFSLENTVTVVTGGAQGLGLVMTQALVASGSNVAIVDLRSKPKDKTFCIRRRC